MVDEITGGYQNGGDKKKRKKLNPLIMKQKKHLV